MLANSGWKSLAYAPILLLSVSFTEWPTVSQPTVSLTIDPDLETLDTDSVADGDFNRIAGAETSILGAGACFLCSFRIICRQHAPYVALVFDRFGRFNGGTFSIGGIVVGLRISSTVGAIVTLDNITVGDAEQGEGPENEYELHFAMSKTQFSVLFKCSVSISRELRKSI